MKARLDVAVTGVFGYSGRHIAGQLLQAGWAVRTLTRTVPRVDPFRGKVPVFPLAFDEPEQLVRGLSGVEVLVNTYWVRFNHAGFDHETAVHNSSVLFDAARRAGVRRVVHVSITNPSEASTLSYFRGKARVERALRESGLSHAILRPAVFFGDEDILINNIAWALRRFPVFAVFGRGDYAMRPVHVEDFAARVVAEASGCGNSVTDAVGPERWVYRDLVRQLGAILGCSRPLLSVPPRTGWLLGRFIGVWQRDAFITRDEIRGLMAGLLDVDAPSIGPTRLSDWARQNAGTLGRFYASELARRGVRVGFV